MKAFLVCLIWVVVPASSQLVINDGTNRTDSPTPAPPPTDFPTPELPFEFMPWGDTNFGHHYQDLFYWAYQHAIRRPGWSWNEPLAGYGPFCFNETCYSVTSACQAYEGTLLHESYCSFPENVKIAGPSCWEDDCIAEDRETCASVGGITIGDDTVEWCLFTGDRTVFGPVCYRGECHPEELAAACDSLNGKVWNQNYCILDDYYTVVGPVCWGSACFASTVNECIALEGTSVAKWWCLVKGCDYTVIGPTCSMIPENDQCFEEDTVSVCNAVGGSHFCLIPGTDWTMIGPNEFFESERINDNQRFCRELRDEIGPPFSELESYDIGGRFCLVKRRLPPIGPYCQGNTCYSDNNTQICEDNGGERNGPFMCALPPTYRRAEGPLMWNGEILSSTAPECTGLFCAIPEPNVGENLRCPTSKILGGPPTTLNPAATQPPSGAPSTSMLGTLIGLVVVAVVSLW